MAERAKTVVAWWRAQGEPMALTLLALVASALLLLWVLGVLPAASVARALLALAWCVGALLLLRLPRYLQSERARLGLLLGGGAVVVAAAALVGAVPLRVSTLNAQEAANQDALTFVAPPRISRDAFIGLLEQGHGGNGPSPAAPVGGELYDIIVSYGIDPAVALAFFARESQFCTTGMCIGDDMKTWGHLRNAYNPARSAGYEYNNTGQFVKYASWQDSVRDWCELMLNGYVARGLLTVDAAVPVYAPLGDGDNNPPQYIDSIYAMVRAWQGLPFVTRQEPHVYGGNLQEALLIETFMASDLEFHPNWGFHRYMLEAIGAGQPLGAPLSPSIIVTVRGQRYAVQTFAMDTIYTPLASPEEETNWNDVRRLSDLLRNAQP
jgi:hypothetical protein